MRKLMLFMAAALVLSMSPGTVEARRYESGHRVVINRQLINTPTVVFDQNPYIPLRTIVDELGGKLHWNQRFLEATVTFRGVDYVVNGFIEDDRFRVNLAEIERIFNVKTAYDPEHHIIVIDNYKLPCTAEIWQTLPSFTGFDDYDWYWLSRIVHAEARGETYESRLAVANVVLNRRNHYAYPDTVKEVIFDRRHGVQFTPTVNGAINLEPDAVSRLAALDALEGRNNAPGALFFINPRYATNLWVPNNRQYAFTIGAHQYFY